MRTRTSLLAQLLARLALGGVFYVGLLIGVAWLLTGAADWPRGWLTIAVLLASQLAMGLWLLKTDPELLRERTAMPVFKSRADKLATRLIMVAMLAWFALVPVDVHYLQLLPSPPAAVSLWAGLGCYFLGMAVLAWTFHVNSFAAPVVKIQAERQQRVIDTGPYAVVRHPMYAGMVPLFAGLGLIMESSAIALAAVPMIVLGLRPRIVIEEATLRRELAGYDAYLARVRARLIPGLL